MKHKKSFWTLSAALLSLILTTLVLVPGAWAANNFKTLHKFTLGNDGGDPGRLILDAAGSLYGTTDFGGSYNNCNGSCGVVFKLDTAGHESVLHNFTGGADGAGPFAGLTIDSAGNLYGTVVEGGDLKCADNLNGYGCGVVFKITP